MEHHRTAHSRQAADSELSHFFVPESLAEQGVTGVSEQKCILGKLSEDSNNSANCSETVCMSSLPKLTLLEKCESQQTVKARKKLCPMAGAKAIGKLAQSPMMMQVTAEQKQVANITADLSMPPVGQLPKTAGCTKMI